MAAPGRAFWEHASASARGWALALLTIAVYLPSLAGGFVWDDWRYFVTEPLIRRWDGIVAIWLAPSATAEQHYWPVMYTSFWLEHKLWGLHAPGYHAVNLGLHVLNTLLLWRLLVRLRIPGAWLAAAVFAVHPIHVESVAWIMARKDLLSGLFYLGAVHVWLRHVDGPSTPRALASLALLLLALLSKSIAVTLPASLLLVRWWQTGRIEWRDCWFVAPLVALAAIVAGADLWFYRSHSRFAFDYSAVERALIAGRALLVYAGQLAWPAHLPIAYARWDVHWDDVAAWCAVVGLCVLAAVLWSTQGRIGRGPLAGLAYFVLTLSPVLGFVDFDFMQIGFVADRFAYLASIGPFAVAAGGAAWWVRRSRAAGVAVVAGAMLGLAALGSLTWRQATVYRDDAALARHMAESSPEHWFAQVYLAYQLLAEGRDADGLAAAQRGERLARRSRGIRPCNADYAVAAALLAAGRHAEAEARYRKCQPTEPRAQVSGMVRTRLAEALLRQARYAEGLDLLRRHLRAEPTDDQAHAELGAALAVAGDYAAAAHAYRRALAVIRLEGNEAVWRRELAAALKALGSWDEARAELERALALNPRNVWTLMARARLEAERPGPKTDAIPGRRWLDRARQVAGESREREPQNVLAPIAQGAVLLHLQAYADARDALLDALALDPGRSLKRQTHKLLGEAMEALGDTGAAAEQYQRALDMHPLDHEALELLASVYGAAGRHGDALPLWRTYAEARPRLAESHWRLAETLRRLDRPAAALSAVDQALQIDPGLDAARALRDGILQALAADSTVVETAGGP